MPGSSKTMSIPWANVGGLHLGLLGQASRWLVYASNFMTSLCVVGCPGHANNLEKRAPSLAISYICKNYEYEKDIFIFSNVHFAGMFYTGAKSQCV
jgi:hypothetical protein